MFGVDLCWFVVLFGMVCDWDVFVIESLFVLIVVDGGGSDWDGMFDVVCV